MVSASLTLAQQKWWHTPKEVDVVVVVVVAVPDHSTRTVLLAITYSVKFDNVDVGQSMPGPMRVSTHVSLTPTVAWYMVVGMLWCGPVLSWLCMCAL